MNVPKKEEDPYREISRATDEKRKESLYNENSGDNDQ